MRRISRERCASCVSTFYLADWNDLNARVDRTTVYDSHGNLLSGVAADALNFREAHAGDQGAPSAQDFQNRKTLWENVSKVIYDQNTYGNMGWILKSLGISSQNNKNYNTQFGINLNKPKLQEIVSAIPSNLVAGLLFRNPIEHCRSNCKSNLISSLKDLIC
ncbi:MAG: hypothetical protein Q8L79_18805 [Methylobacter sp.]|uniref:hypothetical protein n=1 Tax=Methylobacter sp. TaxID=2051955 RepID=UPI002731758A|nr:hypothetical protein [Methylobacter sp.]MDP1667159.1 hypothetical protein [Methylobacter sp.]